MSRTLTLGRFSLYMKSDAHGFPGDAWAQVPVQVQDRGVAGGAGVAILRAWHRPVRLDIRAHHRLKQLRAGEPSAAVCAAYAAYSGH